MTKKINKCEVCGAKEIYPVLNLGKHPMCDDLIPIGNKKESNFYPIEIAFCKNCYTAHQQFQIPKLKLFPSDYHYRSRFTQDVLNGMKDLVKSCEANFEGLEKKSVLDIGCNDGSLLNFFKHAGAKTYGIEPTNAFHEAIENGHETIGDYLSREVAEIFIKNFGNPDIITFTNVFAHIEDLTEVIDSLKILSGPKTTIIIENHYLGSVLERHQFDTFYHEHPRTYSLKSFEFIANSLNSKLQSVEFPSRYGGNIRVTISNRKINKEINLDDVYAKEENFFNDFKKMNENIDLWKIRTKKFLNEKYDQIGQLSCKAFPGRAAILVKLLDLNEQIISSVYEKPGSLKIGHYLPGTKIPILSDDELFYKKNSPKFIINLAWHIEKEINSYLKSNGFNGEIFNILDTDDFI